MSEKREAPVVFCELQPADHSVYIVVALPLPLRCL